MSRRSIAMIGAAIVAIPVLVVAFIAWRDTKTQTLATAKPTPIELRPQATAPATTPEATPTPKVAHVPVFAYYYIWFDPTSWDRAKTDYPLLGRYSSDDETVLRQHVQWAKQSGIDGFIVGWKSTPKLNARLEKILRIADEESFKILMIYQALDFDRNPLSINTIGADMDEFIAKHSYHPSLKVFDKPLMIWSGTWKFSAQDIDQVTQKRRESLLILGSAKNVKDYRRVASALDGNAYYWSSVNVNTNDNYESKLGEMAEAVHQYNGLWISPAAPGFDARLVGGTQVIERLNGETLRQQFQAALNAQPDAIGVISWNEFSENTYIEPSEKYGHQYLDVMKELHNRTP